MSNGILLQNTQNFAVDETRLKRAARIVLDQQSARHNACLSIVITDSGVVHELNQRHRQVDATTDVLAFSAPPIPDEIEPASNYLGDILVAFDYVAAQSDARGCCLDETLCLLVIHGTLHLLGHEHDTEAAREHMWAAQSQALQYLGIDMTIVLDYAAIGHD